MCWVQTKSSVPHLLSIEIELNTTVRIKGHEKRPLSGHGKIGIEFIPAGLGLAGGRYSSEHGTHSRHAHACLNLDVTHTCQRARRRITDFEHELIRMLFHCTG